MLNQLINCYHTSVTRDGVGAIAYTRTTPAFALQIPGRVDVASSMQKYEHSQRGIDIDFTCYLQTEVVNGDQIEYPTNNFMRVISVKPYYAQGTIPTYFEVGLLKIER